MAARRGDVRMPRDREDRYREEARLRKQMQRETREERIERAKRRAREEKAAAAAVIYGNPLLSAEDYWRAPATADTWGLLEVSTSVGGEGSYYATSVFWGLTGRTAAELLAGFANTVHRAYDPKRPRSNQFVAYSAPPCTVTVAIQGERALHLALTGDFPVRHRPQRWVEMTMLAQDYYLYDAKKADAIEDARLMGYLTHHFFAKANATLPVAFFDEQTAGCFIKPEGIEPRPRTSGDRAETARRRAKSDSMSESGDESESGESGESDESDADADADAASDSDDSDEMDFDD